MAESIHKLGLLFILCSVLMTVGCKEEKAPTTTTDKNISASYQEQHRPQFHFTPEANWMNDPNGMFYYKGKYHLFYQYFPDSTVWEITATFMAPIRQNNAKTTELIRPT